LAAQQHVPWYEMQHRLGYQDERIYLERHREQKTWSQAQRLDYMNREARHILLASPLIYARVHLEGIVRAMFDPGATTFLKFFKLYPEHGGLLGKLVDRGILKTMSSLVLENPLIFWSNALFLCLELLYLLCACIVLFSRRLMQNPAIIASLLIIAYYIVISGGPTALGRFRHPVMPIICVLAGYGLWLLWIRVGLAYSRLFYTSALERVGMETPETANAS
jgi:hypothetical protein